MEKGTRLNAHSDRRYEQSRDFTGYNCLRLPFCVQVCGTEKKHVIEMAFLAFL